VSDAGQWVSRLLAVLMFNDLELRFIIIFTNPCLSQTHICLETSEKF
jgi:hypothetical protein